MNRTVPGDIGTSRVPIRNVPEPRVTYTVSSCVRCTWLRIFERANTTLGVPLAPCARYTHLAASVGPGGLAKSGIDGYRSSYRLPWLRPGAPESIEESGPVRQARGVLCTVSVVLRSEGARG